MRSTPEFVRRQRDVAGAIGGAVRRICLGLVVTVSVLAPQRGAWAAGSPPVAVADAFALVQDTTLTLAAPGVLNNDSDAEGDALTAVKVTDPAHGTLAFRADGSFDYVPDAFYSGPDSFTYQVNDGAADGNTVAVALTVTLSPSVGPTAMADAYTVVQDVPLAVLPPGVLINDTGTGPSLTAVKVSDPAHGTLALNADGSFVYSPAIGYHGLDIFTYKGNDGLTDGNTVTVVLTVTPSGNLAPVAVADAYSTGEDTPLSVAAPGVLANDSDADSSILIAIKVTDPAHGLLTLNGDGSFTYVPEAAWSGTDAFTYKANDLLADSNVTTVTLTVSPSDSVNDTDMAARTIKGRIDWARHADGLSADRLSLRGKINPRGIRRDLTGATVTIHANGVQLLPPVVLDLKGRAFAKNSYRFQIDWLRGNYRLDMRGLDLRTVLGIPNETGAQLYNLAVRMTIDGAGLDIPVVFGIFECPSATKADKTSRLSFNSKRDRTLTGVYDCNKTRLRQGPDGISLRENGVLEAEGGGPVDPIGDITVRIGTATLVVPFDQMVNRKGTDWDFKARLPGIVRLTLRNSVHNFALQASDVPDVGIPPAVGTGPRSHRLLIQLQVPTADGLVVFDSTVEILQASGGRPSWKR